MNVKQLSMFKTFVNNEKNELLERYIPEVDFNEFAEEILSNNTGISQEMPLEEILYNLLTISQYIETDTTLESVLTDENYDKLHELYVDLTGHAVTGTNETSGNRPTKQHRFPELRGSLSKVHFIYDKDIPTKDSRKSLETWFRTMMSSMNNDIIANSFLGAFYKYDGVSGVFESSNNTINSVLTRKDTDTNTGNDVTHIFKGMSVSDIFGERIPAEFYNISDYGIKTEMLMKYDDFEEFKKIVPKPPKNHRSAASMIINTLDDLDPNWVNYLSIYPLQISSSEYVEVDDLLWRYVGLENGRHQYIITQCTDLKIPNIYVDMKFRLNNLGHIIDNERDKAAILNIPIDGVVITIINPQSANIIGRSDNKNKYQIAFKFPAGICRTIIEGVTFPVGPVSGNITPLAQVKPVKIMGNTITNVSLSNIDKFERLDIHIGDEVLVKYDIIPTLYKDKTCVCKTHNKVMFPTHCPICGEKLSITEHEESGNRTVRCVNNQCPSKVAGKIYNYCNKMNIEGIGLATIEDLCANGILNTIGDLYRIQNHKFEICRLPGYGETKYNNMVKSINTRLVVYPHEFLGSIGIPDLGRRIMKKICTKIDIYDLLHFDEFTIESLMNIDGIGEKTIAKLIDGIEYHEDIIADIMHYIELKPYDDMDSRPRLKVLFSKVRDKELESKLITKYNAEIQDNYTKDTDVLIVPSLDASSSKIDKARKDGKVIMSIDEAREKYD